MNERDADATGSFKLCDGDWRHRPRSEACVNAILPEAGVSPSAYPAQDACLTNADCARLRYAVCAKLTLPVYNYCQTGCVTDADCGPMSLCECGNVIGRCIPTNCSADSDCGDGFLCASYKSYPGCDLPSYGCQRASDQCAADADCASPQRCTLTAQGRACEMPLCAFIGRPLFVEGELRVADVVVAEGWADPSSISSAELPDALLQRLAEEWTLVARMEHASIAAFARFTLDLLAFGAPAELLLLASQAMADETRHACDAFALASGYAGKHLAPAALSLELAPTTADLASSVITTFLEGCIGETVAALHAAQALELATVPAVQKALDRVAEEEARHAELAWRFVQWALAKAPLGLRDQIVRKLRRELNSAIENVSGQRCNGEPDRPKLWDSVLQAHGVLSDAVRQQVRSAALKEVVIPCFETLVESVSAREDSRSDSRVGKSAA